MPELLLELFSEEIPARMQARRAEDLARLAAEALAALSPTDVRGYAGPRRIALAATVAGGVAETRGSERGPRVTAPEQALAGFLRKHRAAREELRQEGEFWVLERAVPGIDAASLIAAQIPALLRRFPWPKSMRWGGTSRFTWVRPLRRILCILDGAVVNFDLRDGEDDGHGLASGDLTEGHRFLSPGVFAVASEAEWRDGLRARHVIVDAAERRALIWKGVVAKAAERGLSVVEDPALLDEVAGLVEWPAPLLGRIDAAYMDLPPEVMQVSMRVNQRYFALRDAGGKAAPWFAFAANIVADDGGAAIVAGNERVLRARFSDARHFWDLDRTRTLESRVEDLRSVTFHAKIGTQYERALRLHRIAIAVAQIVGASVEESGQAGWLCKADLTTGMVGEFPELQGVVGSYYAKNEGMGPDVWQAIRDHYAPRGPSELSPTAPVTVAVALTDKLDQLVQFFRIGEKPTGSGDPYALRRAALGVVRLAREIPLDRLVQSAAEGHETDEVLNFLKERVRVQLRGEGRRHDVVTAAFVPPWQTVGDLERRVRSIERVLTTQAGQALLECYRRAANIVRIEDLRDGPHNGESEISLFEAVSERNTFELTLSIAETLNYALGIFDYDLALNALGGFAPPLTEFFNQVSVNEAPPEIRFNRLKLLASVVSLMNQVADFSKIEG